MKKIKSNTPINDFLWTNNKKKLISFHMPGHNSTKGFDAVQKRNLVKYDITEMYGADNLQNPRGIIKESLGLISKQEGCMKSYFLVNGSTSGNQIVIKYISIHDGELLVSRDCHKSVVNSAIMFSTKIHFVYNKYDNENNVFLPMSLETIREAVEKNDKIKYVLITSPNYYGLVADIRAISDYLHERDIILIVDQAHGCHFKKSPLFPDGALKQNADIVIESTHKTLSSLNQGALLHINSEKIDMKMMTKVVNALLTTSPSYPLMSTIEKSVLTDDRDKYEILYRNIQEFRKKVKFKFLDNRDFSRLVIKVKETGMTGYEVKRYLYDQGIAIEMADLFNIVIIAVPSNTRSEFRKLYQALNKLEIKKGNHDISLNIPIAKRELDMFAAFKMSFKRVHLDEAKGCICGTIVIPYPPGIPVLCYGELIEDASIEFIKAVVKSGGEVIGIEDDMLDIIEV
ncbi:MAG: aminotransferase class V-fold PLP-dependent enzyme [Clostridia bacterium]|nr:aminotransferase class V-fold PLP-dependent enzyme [Clostridia bacterium]